ncbi:hypothetical protein [Acinetobacter sp. WZC-1]|uniref:hypothetical protein n=1 Tax=Acinetobacter sp. WZC-1 TaxID=3459034 RepID=UPI00403DD6C8
MHPTIKVGDSFAVPIKFYDTLTGNGLNISSDMLVTAHIVTHTHKLIAIPTVTVYPDQQTDTGMVLFEVSATDTAKWPAGTALMDIKLEIFGNIRHSQTFQFLIEKSITP